MRPRRAQRLNVPQVYASPFRLLRPCSNARLSILLVVAYRRLFN